MAAVKNKVVSAENSKGKPLFIFYDCEASNSQVFTADIIEIAARCYPEFRNTAFESLIYTSQELGKFSKYICTLFLCFLKLLIVSYLLGVMRQSIFVIAIILLEVF